MSFPTICSFKSGKRKFLFAPFYTLAKIRWQLFFPFALPFTLFYPFLKSNLSHTVSAKKYHETSGNFEASHVK